MSRRKLTRFALTPMLICAMLCAGIGRSAADDLSGITLTQGTAAPFTGILLTKEDFLGYHQDHGLARLYLGQLNKCQQACHQSWWDTPETNVWKGVVIATVIFLVTFYGIGQLKK